MEEKPWQTYGMPEPRSEASRGELSLVDYEIYSGITVPEGFFFVRLDGWKFHSVTRRLRLEKPYDEFFAASMVRTGKELFIPFNPVLGYIFSDEINLLFKGSSIFERVEKIDSVLSGLASTAFYRCLGERHERVPPIAFDCRAIPVGEKNVRAYLVWRQSEAFRDCYNAYAQHALIKEGLSPREAAGRLKGLKIHQLRRLMRDHGLDPNGMPDWHQRGILLYWEQYLKRGYNPIEKREVVAGRRRVAVEWGLARFDSEEGRQFLEKLCRTRFQNERLRRQEDQGVEDRRKERRTAS